MCLSPNSTILMLSYLLGLPAPEYSKYNMKALR